VAQSWSRLWPCTSAAIGQRALLPHGRLGVKLLRRSCVGVCRCHRANVVCVLCTALRDVGGWDVLDFPEVRPGAAAFDLTAAEWPARTSSTKASTCLELPVQDLTDLAVGLPRSEAKRLRQRLRKLDKVGVTSRMEAAQDVPLAVTEFYRLHLAQWERRGINPVHTRPRFRGFPTDAMPHMVERGQAFVAEYQLDGELAAARM
jgi:hypothetical protein